MTIQNFKESMITKAKRKGSTWENFGQKELSKLKEKYNYNPYANQWSETKEFKIKQAIDELNQWTMHFCL